MSLVDVGVVAPPLSLGGGGPVSLVGQLDRANWQGVARDAGERTVDGRKGGVVAMGGVGGIEAMVAEALVLGDGDTALLERVVHVVEGGKVEAEAVLAR